MTTPEPEEDAILEAAIEEITACLPIDMSGREIAAAVVAAISPHIEAGKRAAYDAAQAEFAARLRRAAEGRRAYGRGVSFDARMREALDGEAASFESAAVVVEDPMAMLWLMPSLMWTAEEEAAARSGNPGNPA